MFSLLKAALLAATAYFKFKTETNLDDRIDKSRAELRRIHEEMEKLRSSGDPYATRRADWLRSDFRAESLHLRHLKDLRPRYAQDHGGDGGKNAGGGLQSADE